MDMELEESEEKLLNDIIEVFKRCRGFDVFWKQLGTECKASLKEELSILIEDWIMYEQDDGCLEEDY